MKAAWRALRRAFVEIVSGFLFGLLMLWDRRVDVAIILCVTVWCGYWGTAWVFLIIDRTGY